MMDRLDMLVTHGLEVFAQKLGLGDLCKPVIKRFVEEQVRQNRVPVTAEEIAEELGILKKQKRPNVPRR
jgi:hypothetical protein